MSIISLKDVFGSWAFESAYYLDCVNRGRAIFYGWFACLVGDGGLCEMDKIMLLHNYLFSHCHLDFHIMVMNYTLNCHRKKNLSNFMLPDYSINVTKTSTKTYARSAYSVKVRS